MFFYLHFVPLEPSRQKHNIGSKKQPHIINVRREAIKEPLIIPKHFSRTVMIWNYLIKYVFLYLIRYLIPQIDDCS